METQVPLPQQQAPPQAPPQAPSQAPPQSPPQQTPPLLPPSQVPPPSQQDPPQQALPQQAVFNVQYAPFMMGSCRSEVLKDDYSCEGIEDFFVNTHTHTHTQYFFILFFQFYRFLKIRAKKHIFPSKFMLLESN